MGKAIAAPATGSLEIIFRPDPTLWDGRNANNGWLQELPKPLTKLTWDNAAIISPKTAEDLSLTSQDTVNIAFGGNTVSAWVLVLPGHPDGSATVHLGYGRNQAGKVGSHSGFNAYALRTSASPWFGSGATLTAAGGTYPLALTAHHNLLNDNTKKIDRILNADMAEKLEVDGTHGRPLIRKTTIDLFLKNKANPEFISTSEELGQLPILATAQWTKPELEQTRDNPDTLDPLTHTARVEKGLEERRRALKDGKLIPGSTDSETSLYPRSNDITDRYRDNSLNIADHKAKLSPYAWGMVVDTGSCIGCNACVIGCQSENNCAISGKDQVLMGREMHWIRIDTYYQGDLENPEATFQPMMCQHCEKAPCEPVCPVEATQHSPEGLNVMTYNRCVGTRYCSNNCPYKVRRFNFLQYSDELSPTISLMANPDVTVRSRGVMEKCTYCIQRINEAKIQAEKEDNRRLRDGEIVTACQQACPTQAISFGNISDLSSKVYKLKNEPHNYGLLLELNTMPRTTYLAKVKNPHPQLAQYYMTLTGDEA